MQERLWGLWDDAGARRGRLQSHAGMQEGAVPELPEPSLSPRGCGCQAQPVLAGAARQYPL